MLLEYLQRRLLKARTRDIVRPFDTLGVMARERVHGAAVEELVVTPENIDDVFIKMRDAVLAEVQNADGQVRIALCREIRAKRVILLVDPLNERATAETLSPQAFALRFKRVVVSYNPPMP